VPVAIVFPLVRMSTPSSSEPRDVPTRIHKRNVAARYGISKRLANEWIRRAVVDGAAVKVGRWTVARITEMDAWVMAGAGREHRARRRS
jgi:hypothetical protein